VMQFDGDQDYLDVEDTDLLSMEDQTLTIAAWANFNQFDTFNSILGKTGSTNLNHPAPYDLYTNQGGDGRVQFYGGGGGPGATGPSSQVLSELPPEVEEWQHVAVTLNEDMEVFHYLNGEINGEGFLTTELLDEDQNLFIGSRGDFVTNMDGFLDDVAIFNEALSQDQIETIMSGDFSAFGVGGLTRLQAGDANQDLQFNQIDLVQVQVAATYLSGTAATWGSGDWNNAPGGEVGSPPPGDGLFNQLDVIAALSSGVYLTGPYGAVAATPAVEGDGQTSIIYNPSTGEVAVDAPAGVELTSINVDSAGGIFTGAASANLGGSFDNDADANIFKATFGGSFGSLSFGNVAQTGLAQDFVLNDLTVVGSLAGGGALGDVDLIYVPEPTSWLLLVLGGFVSVVWRRSK